MNISQNAAYECAKQFTLTALEHSLIAATKDPVATAKNVADFFWTLVDELKRKDSND